MGRVSFWICRSGFWCMKENICARISLGSDFRRFLLPWWSVLCANTINLMILLQPSQNSLWLAWLHCNSMFLRSKRFKWRVPTYLQEPTVVVVLEANMWRMKGGFHVFIWDLPVICFIDRVGVLNTRTLHYPLIRAIKELVQCTTNVLCHKWTSSSHGSGQYLLRNLLPLPITSKRAFLLMGLVMTSSIPERK